MGKGEADTPVYISNTQMEGDGNLFMCGVVLVNFTDYFDVHANILQHV